MNPFWLRALAMVAALVLAGVVLYGLELRALSFAGGAVLLVIVGIAALTLALMRSGVGRV